MEYRTNVPADKNADRVFRNCVSAVAMLGHLCALYDRGVFEAGRLMSNLLFQLAVKQRSNTPLLEQVGYFDSLKIIVDVHTLSARMPTNPTMSPLVSLLFGLKADLHQTLRPAAGWLIAPRRPPPFDGFASLGLNDWLDDPVIPTSIGAISRRRLIVVVRDQDGGAHSDPDHKLARSPDYVELVNAFPVSKHSQIESTGSAMLAWDLLPPVTLPILRQIAHEMLSAIWSQSYIRELVDLPTLVCTFRGTELLGAFVPGGYPDLGPIYGRAPAIVAPRT